MGGAQLVGAPHGRTELGASTLRPSRAGEQHPHAVDHDELTHLRSPSIGDGSVRRAYRGRMGMNPLRGRVQHRGDVLFVIAGVVVALALVLWALLG